MSELRVTVREALAQSGLMPLDAQVLLAHVLGRDRAWLVAHATDGLDASAAQPFFDLARRRRDGEPIAYLVGRREFWGLALDVTPDVLIPRPETETLVEVGLELLGASPAPRILDLGTGSGAIALALARERPGANVLAVDASAAALGVAQRNAARLGITNVRFAASDWFADVPADAGPFDLIVANPPYIASADPHLREGDLRHEPAAALVGGADGLAALRTIVDGASAHLRAAAHLAVEHGHDQAEAVAALLRGAGFVAIGARRDLAGIARVAFGRAPGA